MTTRIPCANWAMIVCAGALDVVELLTPTVLEELEEILQTKPPADPMANYRTTASKM